MASGTFYPAVSGDDGYWVAESSELYAGSDFLYIGDSGGNNLQSFIRFLNVTIPQGATVTEAYVRFTSYNNEPGTTVNWNVYFNNIDTAVAPTTQAEAEALDLTSAVAWNNVATWTDGTQYNTPELKTVLQTVIDRGGWGSGNALQAVIKNNSSSASVSREPSAIDYSSGAEKAELHVTWSAPIDASIAESLSSDDDTVDTSQGVLAESLSVGDSLGTITEASLSESLSADDSNAVVTALTLDESLSTDDGLAVTTEITVAESLSADDSVSLKWNAQCLNEESLSVESLIDIIHSNIYGRYKNSLNYSGNTLQLKIQNNAAGETFSLHDLGLLLYVKEVQRQFMHSMNLKSQNIRLKIQNDTAGETLHLLDVGTKIYENEAR